MSRERLQQLLAVDAAALEPLADLSPEAIAALVRDLEAAHRAEAADLQQQMRAALEQLPWVLRGPIRRLFGLG